MRVRLLVGLSGPAYSLGPGDERDFPSDEASRLIAAGYAVPVSSQAVEMATKLPAPERRNEQQPPANWDNSAARPRRTKRKLR